MTITGAASRISRTSTMRIARLVIIATALCGTAPAGAAASAPLTTPAVLTTVVVDGSSVYDAPALFPAYARELARPVSRDGAKAVVEAIAAMYVRDGYVEPEVIVADSPGAGVMRVRVHEAQITGVTVEGGGPFADRLAAIGTRLQRSKPLRSDDVPRALREMRRFGGLAVNAGTRRDPAVRNGFELVVKADFSPVDGVIRMNNRGTDQVGPAFMLGQVFANGLFGKGEKIGLIFASATETEEFLGGGLYLDAPLGAGGTRANALLFTSRSAPNEAPVNLDHEYERDRITMRVSHPVVRSSTLLLTASGAFELDNLTIDRQGIAIREDRLRIAEAALRATWRAAGTQFSANLQLRHGIDGLGAGLDAGDLLVDRRREDFIVTLAQATALRRFADRWSLRLDTFAQWSGYVLPDTERFKIGGDRLGRGFEVAGIAGDRGVGGKLELRRELADTGSMAGRLSTYGFYDVGAAWKQDRPGRESATTAGLGVAMQGAALTCYLEVAAPLTGTDVEGKRDASVFAELSYRF